MNTPKSERMFDLRVVHRYIASGRVAKDEYNEFLGTLPDLAESIKARDEGGDDDGYDRPIATEPRRGLGLPFIRPAYNADDDDDEDDDDDDDDDGDDDGDDDSEDADGVTRSTDAVADAVADPPAGAPTDAAPEDATEGDAADRDGDSNAG
jgi:hypothetical protein